MQPIGLFDSGVGGLTVLSVLHAAFPNESFIYIGDTKRAPFGDRSVDELWEINQELIETLLQKDIKALVLACNTSCALFLDKLKETLPIPVIGLIPAATKLALEQSTTQRIAVLGTTRTIEQQSHKKNLLAINATCTVFEQACPELVPIVESATTPDDMDKKEALNALINALSHSPDTLIHGCTHYPFFQPIWERYLTENGRSLNFINPATAIIPELQSAITPNLNNEPRKLEIHCTGPKKPFKNFLQTHFPLLNNQNLC